MFLKRSPRFPVDLSAVLDDGRHHATVGVHDLSESGLFATTHLKMDLGTILKVTPLGDPGLPEMRAEVVRQTSVEDPSRDALFGLGLRFVDLNTQHKIALQNFCRGKIPRAEPEDTAPISVWSENEGIEGPLELRKVTFGAQSDEVTQVVTRNPKTPVATRPQTSWLPAIALLLMSGAFLMHVARTNGELQTLRETVANPAPAVRTIEAGASAEGNAPVAEAYDQVKIVHDVKARILKGTKKSAIVLANVIDNPSAEPMQIDYVRTQIFLSKGKRSKSNNDSWRPAYDELSVWEELVGHGDAPSDYLSAELKTMLESATVEPRMSTSLQNGGRLNIGAAAILPTASKNSQVQIVTEIGLRQSDRTPKVVTKSSVTTLGTLISD